SYLERCIWVHTEHGKGRLLKEIAQVLGVSPSRASQLNAKGGRRLKNHMKWYDGLSSRTANRLMECGYSSREQVSQALLDGVITDKPSASQRELLEVPGQQTTIPGLGAVSFTELRKWLELPHSPDQKHAESVSNLPNV